MVVGQKYCSRCGHSVGCVGHNPDVSSIIACANCLDCKNNRILAAITLSRWAKMAEANPEE